MDPGLIKRYDSPKGAAAYRNKYKRSWSRRLSHRREVRILRAALTRAEAKGPILDCPCGAGRMTPHLLARAERVTCVDIAEAMLVEARDALRDVVMSTPDRLRFYCAPADALPFEDNAFDTTLCHRLVHHIPDAEERRSVLRELSRVTSRRLICSFSDASTRKAKSQNRRGVTRNRFARDPEDFAREAAEFGLTMMGAPLRLNGITSLVAIAVFAVDTHAAP